MGYVGNEPSVNFTSFAKQDIIGDGGANYTLTYAVANANEIEVFVNNVRQEPSVAYTVSGTALTMTGNVASTDDFYVIYLGKALQTTVPPDGSVSTAKIADNAVTSAKLDTNIAIDGDLTVDTSTLKVDSTNNRVGIGTASPADVPLSVFSGGAGTNGQLKLGYDGSNYWQIGRLDPAGTGSGNFQFKPNGGTSVLDVDTSGNLLLGQTSQTNAGKMCIEFNGSSHNAIAMKTLRTALSSVFLQFHNSSNTAIGTVLQNGTNTVSYNTSSDHRLKENVTADWDATTRLKQLNPVRFNFIADADTTVDGFLAHEVQSVVPEAITGTHNEVDADGNPVYQGIDQSKLVPLLVKTIQELEARISALENS
jgi:hypothetical protein